CIPSTLRDGNISKSSGGRGASSLNGSNSSMKEADDHVHLKVHLKGDRREGAMAAVQGAHETTSRELSHGGRGGGAVPDVLRDGGRRDCDLRRSHRPCSNRAPQTARRSARSSGKTLWSS